ncbi:MAG: chemotaxis protein CheX [Anaerolineae bacterium]|nr:chemotaxis protein CheX [Anaerolineae bacterium]
MDVKILNPFLEAAIEVIQKEIGVKAERGDLSLQKSALTTDDVTVLIHLVGEVYGVVMYGMPKNTGLNFVSIMLGQEVKELDSLTQSGIAELGNVISGAATVKFSLAGYSSNISPPMVISGRGVQVSTLDFPRIVVPLHTEKGDFHVHLALKETAPGSQPRPEEFVKLAVENFPSATAG